MNDQTQYTRYGPATARVFLHHMRHGSGQRPGRLLTFTAIVALLLAAGALALLFMNKNSAASQLSQMHSELTAEQQKVAALSQAESGNSGQLQVISGKIGTMNGKIKTIDGALTYLAQFNMTCTQGTNGSTYWSLCANHAPTG